MNTLKHTIHKLDIFLLFALFFMLTVAHSQPNNGIIQDVVMPAPNAAALGKFTEIPVSYYTGVPNISLPITEVTDGPLKLPVALNYHASGVKVAENASWVGMGWALIGGGMITRSILSFPDEDLDKGYFYKGKDLTGSTGEFTQIASCYGGSLCLDTEPDMFHFSIPGYSGKFFFDKDNIPQFIPKQDIKLIRNGVFEQFILLAPDGTKYYFGKHPLTNVLAIERTQAPNETSNGNPTSWYLVRVESYDGANAIDLVYVDENYSYTELAACAYKAIECTSAGGYSWTAGESCQTNLGVNGQAAHTINIQGKRLSQIISTLQTVTLFGNTNREDLNLNVSYPSNRAKQLDSIHIATGAFCKSFVFNYDYFQDLTTQNVETLAESKRLKLLSFLEKSCNGGIINPPHVFTYEGATNTKTVNGVSITRQFLPWRLSKQIDHWGYYNGPNSNDNLVVNVPPSSITIPGTQTVVSYGTALRESVEGAMMRGSLKQIDYPNGGNSKFVMEANDYSATVETASPMSPPLVVQTYANPDPAFCCGQKIVSTNYTFTAAPGPNVKFKLTLTEPFNGGCQGQNDMSVKIRVVHNNQQLGSFSFNLVTGTYVTPFLPISQLIGTNPPLNSPILFELTTTDGWGKFEVFNILTSYTNKKVGGLRIKEMRTNDGISSANDMVRTYTYRKLNDQAKSSGNLVLPPKYAFTGAAYNSNGQQIQKYYTFSSNTLAPLGGLDGVAMAYSEVRESFDGNGYKDYQFVVEYPSSYYSSSEFPFPNPPFFNANGQVQSIKSYNQSNIEVHSVNNIPDNTAITYSNLPGVMYKTQLYVGACPPAPDCQSCLPDNILLVRTYSHRTAYAYRVRETTSKIDGVEVKTTINYDPLNKHLNPVKSEYYNSDGKKITTTFSYPTTLAYQCLRDDLVGRNILSVPTSTKNYVDNLLVSGDSTRWSNWAGGLPGAACGNSAYKPYPWEFYRYEMTFDGNGQPTPGSWVRQGVVNQRSNVNGQFGLVTKFTQENWVPTKFEWLVGGRPYKTILNADDANPYKRFTTQYDYHLNTALLSKVTEIDGQFADFEYDPLMRLSAIKSKKVGNTYHEQTSISYQFKSPSNPRSYQQTTTTYTDMTASGSAFKEKVVWEYLDGLGRNVEVVDQKHSPNQKDVVVVTEYDKQGRVSKVYEPFESALNTGGFVATVPSGTSFTLTEYYNEPLNRVWKITPPAWYPTLYSYGANTSNNVKLNHLANSWYGANQLYQTTIQDPNGNRTISFADKKGRQVLSRRTDAVGGNPTDTYYLFDDKDRLSLIIPPGALLTNGDLIFRYLYDASDNMTTKDVPDAAPVSMRYNSRDLMSLMQDGNLLASPNKWLATNYDQYGRQAQTGFVTGSAPDPNSTFSFTTANKLTETVYDDLIGLLPIYKNKVRQEQVKLMDATNSFFITRNYTYDAHGRRIGSTSNNHTGGIDNYTYTFDWADNQLASTRNHQRLSNDATTTIIETTTYDHAGRTKENRHKLNNLAEVTLDELNYNFADELIERNLGKVPSPPSPSNTSWWLQSLDYAYNPQGWLVMINQATLGGVNNALSACPTISKLPNPGSSGAGTGNPDPNDLFYLELKYDGQFPGMVADTLQKNGNINQVMWRTRGRERQAYNFSYDYLDRLRSAVYSDVNDAGIVTTNSRYNESVTYSDARGNISSLKRQGSQLIGSCWNFGQIDNLTYAYMPGTNKISSVMDAAIAGWREKGFKPGNGTGSYNYDANANLITDPNKGIATLNYNHLNLPSLVDMGANKTISYLYDANGVKLRMSLNNSGVITSRDYYDGIEYNGNSIESIYHLEGRVFNNNGNFRYEYAIADHLGNNRMSFTDKNGNGVVDVTNSSANEILQENHFYPFGLIFDGHWMNDAGAADDRYLFNGIERANELDLNLDLAFYRANDPSVGRWWQVDPLSKPGESVYAAYSNNPLNYVDWLGADTTYQRTLPTILVTAKRDGSHYDNSYVRYGWSGSLADYKTTYGFKGWSYGNMVNYYNQVYGNAHQQYVHAMDSIETARIARERLKHWLQFVNLMPWGGNGFSGRVAVGVRGFALRKVESISARGDTWKPYAAATYKAFERQMQRDGINSILKTRTSLQVKLVEHLNKLAEIRENGGYSSSVEREIRTFQGQLRAINDLVKSK